MNDVEYFCRRAREEREAALKSVHEKVRAVHLEMAFTYDLRAREVKVKERRRTVRIVTAA